MDNVKMIMAISRLILKIRYVDLVIIVLFSYLFKNWL